MTTQKVPKLALRLVTPEHSAFASSDEGGKDRMNMTVYSGGVIDNHWWWDNLVLDLEGVKFKKSTYPVLEDHRTDRKIGFSKKPIVDGGLKLDPETTEFVDTPVSQEFRKLSKEGFPYQASLYGVPSEIQRFSEKETVKVNGMSVKGPGTIWRVWEYKEASVTVFGWDNKTKASAFSREEMEEIELEGGEAQSIDVEDKNKLSTKLEGGESTMDFKELKEKHPELFAQVRQEGFDAGKSEAEGAFSQERQGFQTQITEMKTKFSQGEERMAKMEKELTLSREQNLLDQADKIFAEKFAESDIEPRLEPKVRTQLNHNKFVKDEKLDVEAFKKAIDDELKDWQERMPASSVQGFSTVEDSEDDDIPPAQAEENKKLAADLLSRIGQGQTT